MNISRGFRRLSVLVGLIGLAVLLALIVFEPPGPPGSILAWLFVLFVGMPVAMVLLLGWVIAGFRGSN